MTSALAVAGLPHGLALRLALPRVDRVLDLDDAEPQQMRGSLHDQLLTLGEPQTLQTASDRFAGVGPRPSGSWRSFRTAGSRKTSDVRRRAGA